MRLAPGLAAAALALASFTRAGLAQDPPSASKSAVSLAPASVPGELPSVVFDGKVRLELSLHGALTLWFYQPLGQLQNPIPGAPAYGPGDHFFEIYSAGLEVGAKVDHFGVTMNPRFRDTKSRAFFTSNVWLQQGYLSYDAPHALIKLGKVENELSRLGDETFYQGTLYFDGIKYECDYGLSVEGSQTWESGFGLGYVAQYFVADAATNGSLQDRDTVWVTGAKRQNIGVVRVEPSYRINKDASLRFGAAFEAFYVDLAQGGKGPVVRADADLGVTVGPARVFGEALVQVGQSVTGYPFAPQPATATMAAVPGQASAHNIYGVAGAAVRIWRFVPRYAFSVVRYADVGVTEMIHVPGVTFVAHDNVSLMLEYAYWPRHDPSRSWLLDSSLNMVAVGKF
jgi:hypothetical protein